MIRRPPRSTQSRSSAASDVYKRQSVGRCRRIHSVQASLPEPLYSPGGTALSPDASHATHVDSCVGGVGCALPGRWLCTSCLLYTSPSPRDRTRSRMPSSA
eukprot:TRINITY_DN21162_c0_g1_i1.p1 TRINITY_DN21162_c0_g1~~TRINITY_DN21162_c0_g1_i1.p1  ORF type:complete len:101 (-),score=41.81 TRINITY_DN21162_c0_g1_i1:6-308(-)